MVNARVNYVVNVGVNGRQHSVFLSRPVLLLISVIDNPCRYTFSIMNHSSPLTIYLPSLNDFAQSNYRLRRLA